MILSFLFFAFIAYLLFRLVFDFVIPIYRTTKKVKQTFREMNEQMHRQQQGPTSQHQPSPSNTSTNKKTPLGDYIDFEEVKE